MIHDEETLETGGGEIKVVMLHGRGATAHGMIQLADNLPDAHYLALQASNRTWYPRSFLEAREKNQPHLDSALEKIDTIIERFEKEKVVLLGFSQGACLAAEYAVRNPGKYGGVIAFSGGLIGDEIGDFQGDFEETPVFLGCSENDPHVPRERVEETGQVFTALNADVEKRIYPGRDHTINEDEIEKASAMIRSV